MWVGGLFPSSDIKEGGGIKSCRGGASKYTTPPPLSLKKVFSPKWGGGGGGAYTISPWIMSSQTSSGEGTLCSHGTQKGLLGSQSHSEVGRIRSSPLFVCAWHCGVQSDWKVPSQASCLSNVLNDEPHCCWCFKPLMEMVVSILRTIVKPL